MVFLSYLDRAILSHTPNDNIISVHIMRLTLKYYFLIFRLMGFVLSVPDSL